MGGTECWLPLAGGLVQGKSQGKERGAVWRAHRDLLPSTDAGFQAERRS